MSKCVLIPTDISMVGKRYLLDRGYELKMGRGIDEETLIEDLQGCDALLARNEYITRRVIESAPELKVLAKHGVGLDKIDLQACRDAGLWVTNGPTSNSVAVAEHTVLLILSCAKKLVMFDLAVRSGEYEIRNTVKGEDLEGKTLGIIGMGKIGMKAAASCHFGFGMNVIGYDPYIKPELVPDYAQRMDTMEEVIAKADFLSLHLPATADNKGFFNKDMIALMKPTAYFINAARGALVNEDDLYQALKQGTIAGAGLDVFAKEPFDPDNKLFTLPNITVTPHNAALTYETADRMALHAAMGVDEVLSGKMPTWPVIVPAGA